MSKKTPFSLEFYFQASPQLLFQYISTPSGLSEWFSDDVNLEGDYYTFIWDGSEEYAKLLLKKNNERVKFRWLNDEDDQDDYHFELKIVVDEITKDVSLIVNDFADEGEFEEAKMLWENLVSSLKQVLGSA